MKLKQMVVVGVIVVALAAVLALASGVALAQKPTPPTNGYGALLPGETGVSAVSPSKPVQNKVPVTSSAELLPGETGVSAPAQPFQDKAPASGGYVPALPGEKAAQP